MLAVLQHLDSVDEDVGDLKRAVEGKHIGAQRLVEEARVEIPAHPLRARLERGSAVGVAAALPGVIAGSMLVFIPAVGEFVIPDLLGGSSTLMIGKTLWDEFFHNRDWPMASTVAVILLIVLVVPVVFFQNAQQRARARNR